MRFFHILITVGLLGFVSHAGAALPVATRLTAVPQGPREVELSWDAPAEEGLAWRVERRRGERFVTVATLPAGVTKFTDAECSPLTDYLYRVSPVRTVTSPPVRAGEKAATITMSLDGMALLTLETLGGPDGIDHDHAVFAAPKIVDAAGVESSLKALGRPINVRVGWGQFAGLTKHSIAGEVFEEGLMLHARGTATFRLGKPYARFVSRIGTDDAKRAEGRVAIYRVTGTPDRATIDAAPTAVARTPDDTKSPGDTSYHIDSVAGNDTADGTSPETAWRSLRRVNQLKLTGGDRLLFKRNSKFLGRLWPHGEGTAEKPILIDAYGDGATPVFDAEGKLPETIRLHNTQYVTLQNLEVINKGPERVNGLTGVQLSIADYGTAHNIAVRGLFIHDVYGSNVKADNGGYGISWKNQGGGKKSRFDGLRIEYNHLLRTDRNGITGSSDYCGRTDWYPSLNVRVANNLLEDIGGDGIVPIGTDGCVVENNVIRGCRTRAQDAAAGIWPWSADNTLIQFNEVSQTQGTIDGQSFDADWNCVGTIIQYNYSHDNAGGFVLVCCDGTSGKEWSAQNRGTIIRYNVSVNDGSAGGRTFQIAGPIFDAKIYNNTIYLDERFKQPIVWVNNWGGWAESVLFENNIFHSSAETFFHLDGRAGAVKFSGNVYSGPQRDRPLDRSAIIAPATFVKPPESVDGLAAFQNWMLAVGSPLRGKVTAVKDNGGRDAAGNAVLQQGAVDPGAVQSK